MLKEFSVFQVNLPESKLTAKKYKKAIKNIKSKGEITQWLADKLKEEIKEV